MMGPAFSSLDLEVVQARHEELTREFHRSQPLKARIDSPSRIRVAIRAVTTRIER